MPPGSTAVLPGAPATLLRYVDLGVSTLLIRGFTPLADARDYGTLARLVREQADPAALVSAR